MSNEEDKMQASQNESENDQGQDQSAQEADEASQNVAGSPDVTAAALEALSNDNAELKDKLMRTLADMENLRARTEREKKDMAKYAVANFARDILTIGDNISRTIQAVPEESINADPALKTLVDGIEMTERELSNTLDRYGVKLIDCEGEPFDPNIHQAMFEVPNPDITAGIVVEVVQNGYMIGERVLRPAGVGVSKGGAKRAKEEPAEETKAQDTPKPDPIEEPSDKSMGKRIDKNA